MPTSGHLKRFPPATVRRKDGLLQHFHNTTSQCGEDGILGFIFGNIVEREGERRYAVEVGSWDGKHLSNTYQVRGKVLCSHCALWPLFTLCLVQLLHQSSLWDGILIEADAVRSASAQAMYDANKLSGNPNHVICANLSVGISGPTSLANILETLTPPDFDPSSFDLLSIDVDGWDYYILEDILNSATQNPKVICVEFNPTIPLHIEFVQEKNEGVRQGKAKRRVPSQEFSESERANSKFRA